jgi:hypothetical protein
MRLGNFRTLRTARTGAISSARRVAGRLIIPSASAAAGEIPLPFEGIANPEQLAVLTKMLDDHCRNIGLAEGHPEREALAHRVMALFNNGILDIEDLTQALATGRDPD